VKVVVARRRLEGNGRGRHALVGRAPAEVVPNPNRRTETGIALMSDDCAVRDRPTIS
jgi:hypothetical protein